MLKSTYRPLGRPVPLPPGWTEHKAPTGHLYYYNAATQESTYSRPSETLQHSATPGIPSLSQPPYETFNSGLSQWGNARSGVYQSNVLPKVDSHGEHVSSTGHNVRQRALPKDRPKSRHVIPDCSPWLLVKTRLGRRFVYNPERGESFWKFPLDVMKGVVEYDRLEREKRLHRDGDGNNDVVAKTDNAEPKLASKELRGAGSVVAEMRENTTVLGEDGEEYEEVEVTDDENDENPSKRQKTEDGDSEQPVEFNEDDIAYQLAAMGQDYGLDPGEYGDGQEEELEEGAEGLALTEEDSTALFRDMLDDHHINPYTTWEKLIEIGQIVEDQRYIVLPNMNSRKDVWIEWSRDKVQHLKQLREQEERKDPRISYFHFLQRHATPKLYWPEFRRKYKKEPELRDTKLSDKDREKAYREYINRLKLPETTLKSDLINLLKSIPSHTLNRSTPPDALPSILLTDLRYASLRPSIRDPLIETHISILPLPPSTSESPSEEQEGGLQPTKKQERERRERALADRQKQVQDEKRRQRGAIQFSKGVLREGEAEIERAMRVGKEGLKGYMIVDT